MLYNAGAEVFCACLARKSNYYLSTIHTFLLFLAEEIYSAGNSAGIVIWGGLLVLFQKKRAKQEAAQIAVIFHKKRMDRRP